MNSSFICVVVILMGITLLVMTVSAQEPDLGVWTFVPPSGDSDRTFNVFNSVKNYGTGDAGQFRVNFYVSNDTTFTISDTLIGCRTYSSLAAGVAAPDLATSMTVPMSAPAGSYYVGMIIDPADEVTESEEGNNVFYDTDMITLRDPDITIWTFTPPDGDVNRSFTIHNSVRNVGTGDAGPFTVNFYISPDTVITPDDILIGSREYSGLLAGITAPNSYTSVKVPPLVPAGSYYVGMIIDPADVVPESDEGNNVFHDINEINIAPPPQSMVGVFRPSTRQFILKNGAEKIKVSWGESTDTPVIGDWNGDTIDDVGVHRAALQKFVLDNDTEKTVVKWGLATDTGVAGDWNGDGMGDVGVFRSSLQKFVLKNGTQKTIVKWGLPTDMPVSGDWNGDGLWDIGVYRPSTGEFLLKKGNNKVTIAWGQSTDLPLTGDWDSDGLWEVGVFRPSETRFMLDNDTTMETVTFGQSGDLPVGGRWI